MQYAAMCGKLKKNCVRACFVTQVKNLKTSIKRRKEKSGCEAPFIDVNLRE